MCFEEMINFLKHIEEKGNRSIKAWQLIFLIYQEK